MRPIETLRRARHLSLREWRDLGRAHVALLRAYWSVRRDDSGLTRRKLSSGRDEEVREVTGEGDGDRAKELTVALERCMEYGPFRFHCLVQALALRRMLEQEGIEGAAVRVGVRRDGTEFAAHAWVELDGAPLLESPGFLEAYTPLPELDVFPERTSRER